MVNFFLFHPDNVEGSAGREGNTMNSYKMLSAMTQILQSLARWPGVTLNAHRYGGLGVFVEGQELGQLHDCGLLDVSLTTVDRDVLLKEGRVHPHHTFPDSGWVTLPLDGIMDVPLAMKALRMAHARVPHLTTLQSIRPQEQR